MISIDMVMKFGFILALCTNVSIVLFVAFALWRLNREGKASTNKRQAPLDEA